MNGDFSLLNLAIEFIASNGNFSRPINFANSDRKIVSINPLYGVSLFSD